MNCPKCGKEMGSGFLQTGNIIAFNKNYICLFDYLFISS